MTVNYYPQKLISSLGEAVADLWIRYVYLVGVKEENMRLKEEVAALRGDRVACWEAERERDRLRGLVGFRRSVPFVMLPARVIASSPSLFRTDFIVIDRGRTDGVYDGMPVVTKEGVVGRVFASALGSSQVVLVTDGLSAVDAYVQRTRARGIVKGTGDGCVMEYLWDGDAGRVGDKVVTSGKDGFFPKGIVVGTVTGVESHGTSIKLRLTPEVNPDSLDEVFVILRSVGSTGLNE
jgi:rod shape-determining protein MreC